MKIFFSCQFQTVSQAHWHALQNPSGPSCATGPGQPWSSAPTLLPIPKRSRGHSNSPPGDNNNPLWKQSVHQAKCDQPDGLTSVWLGSSERHHAALLISAQSAQISEFLTPPSSDARDGHSLLCTSPFRTTDTSPIRMRPPLPTPYHKWKGSGHLPSWSMLSLQEHREQK